MSILGSLVENRRGLDAPAAWNRANLQSPQPDSITDDVTARGRITGTYER